MHLTVPHKIVAIISRYRLSLATRLVRTKRLDTTIGLIIILLSVIALAVSIWHHISLRNSQTSESGRAGGFVTFYDADSGWIKKIKLDPASTTVLKNSNGTKYLLQSENPNRSTSICDINGCKLEEILLAGEHIATSNRNDVTIKITNKKDKNPWELIYDYAMILSETHDQPQNNSDIDTPAAKIIMWSESDLAIYDKNENEIYKETFFGRNLKIEKVLPCANSKIIVFTSEDEYPEKVGPDWEDYKVNRRISFSILRREAGDFKLNLETFEWPSYGGTELLSVEQFYNIAAVCSLDGTEVNGTINDLTAFLINIETGQILLEPLQKVTASQTK